MSYKLSTVTLSEEIEANPSNSTDSGTSLNTKFKLSVLLILWAVAFIPVYPSLISTWVHHSNNSHGILVPLISAFLIWRKLNRLSQVPVTNSSWGLVLLVCALVLYILSYAGAVAFVSRGMIVFSLIGLILFTLGNGIFRLSNFLSFTFSSWFQFHFLSIN